MCIRDSTGDVVSVQDGVVVGQLRGIALVQKHLPVLILFAVKVVGQVVFVVPVSYTHLRPPTLFFKMGRRVLMSILMPSRVLISETASAPCASTCLLYTSP